MQTPLPRPLLLWQTLIIAALLSLSSITWGEPQKSPQSPKPDILTPLSLEQAQKQWKAKGDYFLYISSDDCGNCAILEKTMLKLPKGITQGHKVFDMRNFENDWYQQNFSFFDGYPSLLFVRDGQPLDVLLGAARLKDLQNFFERNLSPKAIKHTALKKTDRHTVRKHMRAGTLPKQADLSGLVLGDVPTWKLDLSGANLRGTDLRGADFTHTTFSRADLTGARLDGANVYNVFWGACTCPDGTSSADHGHTCQGHLNAKTTQLSDKQRRKDCRTSLKAAIDAQEPDMDPQRRVHLRFVVCRFATKNTVTLDPKWSSPSPKEAYALLDDPQHNFSNKSDFYTKHLDAQTYSFYHFKALTPEEDAIKSILVGYPSPQKPGPMIMERDMPR